MLSVVAAAAAVAIAATWAAGGFSSGSGTGAASILRGREGWTLTLPRTFHQRTFDISDLDWEAHGVSIGNFEPLPAPANGEGAHIPAHGVLFELYTVGDLSITQLGKENALPLKLHRLSGTQGASRAFAADGTAFIAFAGTGSGASRNDRRALSTMIASLRFSRLRVGELTGDERFYVLKAPAAYPLGSVTRVDPRAPNLRPFFLIHDYSGFRTIGSEPFPCDVRFDRAHSQFFCRGGGRWDSAGNVIVNPPGAEDIEPLEAYLHTTSQGHLLVSESVGYVSGCAENLARHVPACPNYQPVSSSSRTS